MQQLIAGIDVGGTKIGLGLCDVEGRSPAISRFPTEITNGPQRIIDEALIRLRDTAADLGGEIVAAGVCCGGPLDRKRGLILSPPNLRDWDRFPIVEQIEDELGVPAILDNDANAAALGELHYGAGRGLTDLAYLTISTGIGGGLIVAGHLVHGVADAAGEIGHITVLPDGPACPCGSRGCLEVLASGTSIARRARERLQSGSLNSSLNIDDVTAKTVADAAMHGDVLAREVWDETIHFLGIGISTLVTIMAPQAVILGGGVSMAGDQLLLPLRQQVERRVTMLPKDKIKMVQAGLGSDSGIHGALLLGQEARDVK